MTERNPEFCEGCEVFEKEPEHHTCFTCPRLVATCDNCSNVSCDGRRCARTGGLLSIIGQRENCIFFENKYKESDGHIVPWQMTPPK